MLQSLRLPRVPSPPAPENPCQSSRFDCLCLLLSCLLPSAIAALMKLIPPPTAPRITPVSSSHGVVPHFVSSHQPSAANAPTASASWRPNVRKGPNSVLQPDPERCCPDFFSGGAIRSFVVCWRSSRGGMSTHGTTAIEHRPFINHQPRCPDVALHYRLRFENQLF